MIWVNFGSFHPPLKIYILKTTRKMQTFTDLFKKLKDNLTLSNFLQLVAFDTWKRVEFGRTRKGFKVYETTITQNILYQFCIFSDLFPEVPIRMFEAKNERHDGNDIELIIRTSKGCVIFPIQAKIIYGTGDYPAMDHGDQINNLIRYANSIGGVPLYLLYNYYPDSKSEFHFNNTLCGINYTIEQFGCSLVSAHYLRKEFAFKEIDRNGNKKWNIPKFKDLHSSVAVPWFVLGCTNSNILEIIGLIENTQGEGRDLEQEITMYPYGKLIEEWDWQPLEMNEPSVGFFEEPFSGSEDTIFNPKYRIILG
jgi:hypothetical protein